IPNQRSDCTCSLWLPWCPCDGWELLVAAGEQEESRRRPKLSCASWQVGLSGSKLVIFSAVSTQQFVPDFLLLTCWYQEASTASVQTRCRPGDLCLHSSACFNSPRTAGSSCRIVATPTSVSPPGFETLATISRRLPFLPFANKSEPIELSIRRSLVCRSLRP